MQHQKFNIWLDRLKDVWETKSPNKILDIVAQKFVWQEGPFDEPITTKEGLINEWNSVLNHKDVNVSYKMLVVEKNVGIAQFHATYVRLSSGENLEIDGVFMISLDENGKCIEFSQWYNEKNKIK